MPSCRHVGAAVLAACAGWAAPAQAAPCLQGSILASSGGTGRIEICTEIAQQVPQLQAAVDKLLKAHAASDDRLREIERLLQTVNAAASRVDNKQAVLARSLAHRLAEAGEKPDSGAMRDIRRLSDAVEEVLERLAAAQKDEKNAEAAAALKGPIGEAVAVLDLDKANRLLGGIEALQKQLTGVESKIDGLSTKVGEGNDVAVLAEATRSKARGDIGQVRALATLAGQGRTFDGHDFSGMGLAGARVPGLKAPGADFSLSLLAQGDLAGATLEKARLLAASMSNVNLAGAVLRKVRAALADARQSNLQGADLSLGNWLAADLRGANLRSANLRGTSLEHADLRGADLSGADLSGAFLGNADLRDARLDGARFANTDVSSALLATPKLTAQQQAGLCATVAERSQAWTVVEKIPTARFSGGYEYDRIFDNRLWVGAGGHRPYPQCAPRGKEDITDWNPPVYGGGPGRWSDAFGFTVDHALLERPGMRRELLERVRAAHDLAQGRKQLVHEMPQFASLLADLNRKVEQRLGTLLANPAPANRLFFDTDTALLVALRLRPQLLQALEFDWLKASASGFSDMLGRPDTAWAAPWPRLFPAEMQSNDYNSATTAAFEKWTRARSRALPSNDVELALYGDVSSPRSGWHRALVHMSRVGEEDPLLAKALGADPAAVVAYGDGYSAIGAGKATFTAFKVETDIDAFRAAVVKPGSRLPKTVTATVTDVRFVPAGPSLARDYLVWTLVVKHP
jgi:uncharacterized protein YjbI with pentapeptide repeats